jgi:hypothetical protein
LDFSSLKYPLFHRDGERPLALHCYLESFVCLSGGFFGGLIMNDIFLLGIFVLSSYQHPQQKNIIPYNPPENISKDIKSENLV